MDLQAKEDFLEQREIKRQDQTIYNDPLFSQRSSQPDSARPMVSSVVVPSESGPFNFEDEPKASDDP